MSLCLGEKRTGFQKVIITGVNRSGKSLIGRLLGSLNNIDYMDEPWLLNILPVYQANKLIDSKTTKYLLRSYIEELFNDVILLRQANFRPRDQSSIWSRKGIDEITNRLIGLHSRDDVRKYANSNKMTLLLNAPYSALHMSSISDAIPECKIINVVRNGLDVAMDLKKKKWYSNKELKQPICNGLLYKIHYSKFYSGKYYIPWWVKKGEEEKFLKLSDFAKGLYFWRRNIELTEKEIKKFKIKRPNQYKEVRFENILKNPDDVMKDLCSFLNADYSKRTQLLFSSLDKKMHNAKKKYPVNEVPEEEKAKVKKLLARLNYPLYNLA